jgi:hypothetical protein
LFGDCVGLALTLPKNASVFLVATIEFISKSRIGFSTRSAQSSSSNEKGVLKNVNGFA